MLAYVRLYIPVYTETLFDSVVKIMAKAYVYYLVFARFFW